MHQGCQIPFRISRRNVEFLSRRCSGKGPHLAMTGEPLGFSRVAAEYSTSNRELREHVVLPQGSPISIRVARGSWGLLSSRCRAKIPHLGFCPKTPCSSPVATGISGLHSRFTQGVRPRLELKQRTPLSSRVVPGISWRPLSGLKGVKPLSFGGYSGLLSRPFRKRRASSPNYGGISWLCLSCGVTCAISLEYHGEIREPLVGPQGSPVYI